MALFLVKKSQISAEQKLKHSNFILYKMKLILLSEQLTLPGNGQSKFNIIKTYLEYLKHNLKFDHNYFQMLNTNNLDQIPLWS